MPFHRTTTLEYDPASNANAGQLKSRANPDGGVIIYTHDLRGHLVREEGATYPVEYEHNAFDEMVKLKTRRAANGGTDDTTWTYEAATGLLLNKKHADNKGPSYTYSPGGQMLTRATLADRDNQYWDYSYNTKGEVTEAAKKLADSNPVPGLGASYVYDEIGNRKESNEWQNIAQVGNSPPPGAATYTTNALNQYSARSHPNWLAVLGQAAPGASIIVNSGAPAQRQGEWFAARVSGNNASAPAWLPANLTASMTVAGSGTASHTLSTTRQGHLFLPPAQEVFTYDDDGNLTGDARWSYAWDGENRLKSMETSAGAAAAGVPRQRMSFDYDGGSRRIRKQVWAWVPPVAPATVGTWTLNDTRLFLWSGWHQLAEYRISGPNVVADPALAGYAPVLHRTYLWGLDLADSLEATGDVSSLLAMVIHSDTPANGATVPLSPTLALLPSYDANGNITALSNADGGALAARYDYDAFGRQVVRENLAALSGPFSAAVQNLSRAVEENPWGFSTKGVDIETGLVYYGYRYYSPEMGRWVSKDPIEEMGGTNLLRFNSNNPPNKIDILGQSDIDVILRRESYGKVNTYGDVTVTVNNQKIKDCCKVTTATWNILEHPWGKYKLRIGRNNPENDRDAGNRPFRNGGPFNAKMDNTAKKTTPKALSGGNLPPKPRDANEADYNAAISQAFNTGNGQINIHAGQGSWWSLYCPIIGHTFVGVTLPTFEDRHEYPEVPREPEGFNHTVFGFDLNDSLTAQIEFNMVFTCAERALGKKPERV